MGGDNLNPISLLLIPLALYLTQFYPPVLLNILTSYIAEVTLI